MSAQGPRPSVATGPNTFEITDDRVFGPGGGALAAQRRCWLKSEQRRVRIQLLQSNAAMSRRYHRAELKGAVCATGRG